MNNKYVKYILIVTVIGVWAMIIIRVVSGLRSSDVHELTIKSVPARPISLIEDSFNLYLDYPDPFLDASDKISADTVIKTGSSISQPALPVKTAPTNLMVGEIVQYNGVFINKKRSTKAAIVTILGKEYVVHENDRIGDVKIRKIEKTKLLIVYKGEQFVVDK